MAGTANLLRACGDVAVIGAFVTCSLLPMVMEDGAADDTQAGRTLAAAPERPRTLDQWLAWPSAYEKWFDDHFGGRGALIGLNTWLAVDCYGISPTDQVVLGTEGWLYYTRDGIFADRRGEERLAHDELERWRGVLEGRQAWFAARGVPYVFVVAANKITVHPEHLPARHRTRPDVPTRMDQLVDHLAAHSKFRLLDGRAVLAAAARSEPVYHATDSHWNEIGAFHVYREVMARWRELGLAVEPLPWESFERRRGSRRGDLARLVPGDRIPDEDAWFLVPREPLPGRRVELPPEWQSIPKHWGVWEPPVVFENERGTGVLLAVGDSFQWQWMQYFAAHFRRAVFVSAALTDFDVLQAMVAVVQPTVFLEERAERNMKWLPLPHPASSAPR